MPAILRRREGSASPILSGIIFGSGFADPIPTNEESRKTLMPLQEQAKTMRTITVEEHYATPAFLEGPGRSLQERSQGPETRMRGVPELLCDLDERRIAN